MRVGNDVVDLRDPANRPTSLHPRFDRRVFTCRELELLRAAGSEAARHRLRWTLWAAKEAAVKALRQSRTDLAFRPAELDVYPAPCRGRVRAGDRWLAARLDVTDDRVHAIVSDPPVDPGAPETFVAVTSRDEGVDEAAGAAALRRRCAAHLAARLGLPANRVLLSAPGRGSPSGAPTVRAGGRPLDAVISFSHDGRWDAAVVLSRTAASA